jgi:hypothetical protein
MKQPDIYSIMSMKGVLLLILIAVCLLQLSSCSSSEQSGNGCHWNSNPFGYLPGGSTNQRYSPLSNKLAFIDGDVGIIDFSSGAVTFVNPIQPIVSDSLVVGDLELVDWCPYDGNKLLFVVHLSRKNINDTITQAHTGLLLFNSDGSFDSLLAILPTEAPYLGWLASSRPNSDSLAFEWLSPSQFYATYCPQTGLFDDVSSESTGSQFIRQSASGKHIITATAINATTGATYQIDGKTINLGNPQSYVIGSASFSPDEKHLAIWWNDRSPDGGTNVEWIYDVDAMLSGGSVSPISQLNFANLYCLGSYLGIWGEFVSDTSIVISLHGDPTNGGYCHLYEVNYLNGAMIRQLTFDN